MKGTEKERLLRDLEKIESMIENLISREEFGDLVVFLKKRERVLKALEKFLDDENVRTVFENLLIVDKERMEKIRSNMNSIKNNMKEVIKGVKAVKGYYRINEKIRKDIKLNKEG